MLEVTPIHLLLLTKAELIAEIADKIAAMGGAQKDPALQSDLERRLRAMPRLYNVLAEAETTGGLESTRALVSRYQIEQNN